MGEIPKCTELSRNSCVCFCFVQNQKNKNINKREFLVSKKCYLLLENDEENEVRNIMNDSFGFSLQCEFSQRNQSLLASYVLQFDLTEIRTFFGVEFLKYQLNECELVLKNYLAQKFHLRWLSFNCQWKNNNKRFVSKNQYHPKECSSIASSVKLF